MPKCSESHLKIQIAVIMSFSLFNCNFKGQTWNVRSFNIARILIELSNKFYVNYNFVASQQG